MKILLYTSIYSNLWGTEFGGRPSRKEHYKHSLLNILNMNPSKIICFTSNEELKDLEAFFYNSKGISKDKLEFKIFDLKNTKYFKEICSVKDLNETTKSDRCYEVQYNKFFWLEHIEDLHAYDRVFWIDAGLSHGGIIHSKYSRGTGYERNFNFSLFNEDLLKRISDISKEHILLLSKNNSGHFYWSSSMPQKYYKKYKRDEHIIGGMFGGTPKKILEYKNKFENILLDLINNEKKLFFEELIMTCLYYNNISFFAALKFDDWYDRKDIKKYGKHVRYFYNMLEIPKVCVVSTCFELNLNSKKYTDSAKNMIKSHLRYTNFDIILLTNKKEEFENINDGRVKILDYYSLYNESHISSNKFNMHLKRYPIKLAKDYGYDIIFHNDCDCFINDWDDSSFKEKIKTDYDVFFVSHANPQLGGLIKNYKHFREKVENELGSLYTEDMNSAPNPAETRVIFKNNEKLDLFLSFWDKISNNNKNYFTYYDGVYFGTSAIYAKMKMGAVNRKDDFSKYCFIYHGDDILDYFGVKTKKKETSENVIINLPDNSSKVYPQFDYKGLYTLQSPNIIDVFEKLFLKIKPKRILEIGTEYGGLTLLLKDILLKCNIENFIVRTYDIKPSEFLINHKDLTDHIEIKIENIFCGQKSSFKLKDTSLDDLNNFLLKDSPNIIICDGGNKIGEFNVLSDLMKSGDIIMVHDYAENNNVFENKIKDKTWNWFEIQESDIKEASERNNLDFLMKDEFEKVAWACKIKK
jgi:cephalosporin hydroxylase